MSHINWLAAALGFLACAARADPSYDNSNLDRARAVIPNLVYFLRQKLDPADARLVSEINFTVDSRRMTQAYTYVDANGKRQVVIFFGMVAVIDILSQISVLSQANEPCTTKYLSYFYEEFENNTQRVLQSLPPHQIITPPRFFDTHAGCEATLHELLNLSPSQQNDYRTLMDGSILFLLLHEIGHHALSQFTPGHTTKNLAEKRHQEADADEWAIQQLAKLIIPASSMPLLLHIAFTNGKSLEDEHLMDHPSGIRRLARLLDASIPLIHTVALKNRLLMIQQRIRSEISAENAN
jgi:hypothetical protein